MASESSEIWREFAEGYEVSNLGRVKSRVKSPTGKILKLGDGRRSSKSQHKDKKGYIQVNTKQGRFSVSRLVAKMFVPNPRPDIFLEVDHIDGNIHNNCWLNLRWLSKGLNMLMSKDGAKLTTFDKRRGNYRSCVRVLKKRVTAGPFATEAEASARGKKLKREAFERSFAEDKE